MTAESSAYKYPSTDLQSQIASWPTNSAQQSNHLANQTERQTETPSNSLNIIYVENIIVLDYNIRVYNFKNTIHQSFLILLLVELRMKL